MPKSIRLQDNSVVKNLHITSLPASGRKPGKKRRRKFNRNGWRTAP